MSNRKRRVDAVAFTFHMYNCKDVIINLDDKDYIYEPVLIRKAKEIVPQGPAIWGLYRDLHKAESVREIYGIRAVCVDDFNKENMLCKVEIHKGAGTGLVTVVEDSKKLGAK